MRKLYKRTIAIFFAALLSITAYEGFTNAGGPPAGMTGASGESTCAQGGCHAGSPITSGSNWNNFSITSNIPASGYVAGSTYTVTISMSQAGINKWGFQATVLNSSNAAAGTIVNTSTGQMSTQSSGGKMYINHNSGGNAGTGSRSWSFDWVAPNPVAGTVTVYACVNAANGDANASSADMIYSKSASFIQTGAPTAIINADKNNVCPGDTVQFTGGGLNSPTGFAWSFPNGVPSSSTQQNPKVVFTGGSVSNVTLTTSNQLGNSTAASQAITIKTAPFISVSPSTSVALCGNDSVTLAVSSSAPGLSYLWSPGNQTASSILVKTAGTYTVKATSSGGCPSLTQVITVTKNPIPVITHTSSKDSTCSSDSVTFIASPAGIGTYTFKRNGATLRSSSSNTFTIKLLPGSLPLYVIASDATGCKSDSMNHKLVHVVEVFDKPAVTADSVDASRIRFKWTAVPGATGYEYSTDTGRTWLAPNGADMLSHNFPGLPGGKRINMRVRAMLTGVCKKSLEGIANAQTPGCAPLIYTVNAPANVCNPAAGDSSALVQLGITTTSSFTTKVDEVTSAGAFVQAVFPATAQLKSFKLPLKAGSDSYFSITVSDALQPGCPAVSKSLTIHALNIPAEAPVVTLAKITDVMCEKEAVTFRTSIPAGANKFSFTKNNIQFGTTSRDSFVRAASSFFATGDKIHVIAIDTVSGCRKTSAQFTVKKQANPKAGFTSAVNFLQVQFTDTTTGAISWSWSFGDGQVSSDNAPAHTYAASGMYDVQLFVTDDALCVSDTPKKVLNVFNTGLRDELSLAKDIRVFPNPVSSALKLTMNLVSAADVQLNIMDLSGKQIASYEYARQAAGTASYELKADDFARGTYLLVVKIGDQQKTISFMKQ